MTSNNYSHYTPSEVRTIRVGVQKKLRRVEIATKIRRSPAAVTMLTHRLQWNERTLKSKRRPYGMKEMELILRWRRDGTPYKKIASAIGRTNAAVRKAVCNNDVLDFDF